MLRRPGLVGAPLRAVLRDAYDSWLRNLCGHHENVALVAIGSLGRGEPAPYSDLDLVLLHDGEVDGLADLADAIWYPIWDSGIGLDHSVRTPDQAVSVAKDDLKALLGLIDIRHVAGDAGLTGRVRDEALGVWRKVAIQRVSQMREISRERWKLAGEGAFLLEPNLKDSRGGLRDVQQLHALAVAQLVDFPSRMRAAQSVLLDVRGELHRAVGRADDVLRLQEHDSVAAALGYADTSIAEARDVLLRDVHDSARAVAHALDLAFRRIEAQNSRLPGRRWWAGPGWTAGPERIGLARNVVSHDGEITLARDADPCSDVGLVLRVARAAAEHDMPITPFALDRLVTESVPLPTPWPHGARDDLLAVLGAGHVGVTVLEALDQAGLLTALIPEWGTVRSLAQHNPVHRFTVDRHLLETAAEAAEYDGEVERRDLLLIGALLHDIGKGYPGGDHSVVGAEHARTIAQRMGFTDSDLEIVVGLVRHHLLLPNTATRRDLDDPMTIDIVREAVGRSRLLLDLLPVLAHADATATGPAAWSDWKAGLVTDLAVRVRAAMEGAPVPADLPLDDERRLLAESGEVAVVVRSGEVVVAAPDAAGTLYRTAGVLALHLLDVREASVRTHEGMAVNRFVVEPRFGRMPDPALVRADLARAFRGELGLAAKLAEKERTYARDDAPKPNPLTVHWFDDATDATVVEFRGRDEIGLLSRITAALEHVGLDVRSARVSSVAGFVVDAFYVTDRDGRAIAADRRPGLAARLQRA